MHRRILSDPSARYTPLLLCAFLAVLGCVGCNASSQTADSAKSKDSSRNADARPSANEIQDRMQKVQNDPKLSSEAKALLTNQMQGALRDNRTPSAP